MFRRFKPITNPTQIPFRHSSSPSNANQEPHDIQNNSILPLDLAQSPLASATAIAEQESLLTEILIELPPKSLLRFQCVSKKWISIISDPAFRRLHWRTVRRNITSDLLFFSPDSENNEVDFVSLVSGEVSSMGTLTSHLRKDFLKDDILRVESCNGLWCMQLKDKNNRISLIVCNPTTCVLPCALEWIKNASDCQCLQFPPNLTS